VILYTRFQPEDLESAAYTVEIARLMAPAARVPIYSTTDLYMGTGVVGGMMRGSEVTGARLGQLARQILDGARADAIPIEMVKRVPTFDWRQLRRWGIDESRLPPGSDIQFRTPTTWESYQPYIIGTIIVIAAQLMLIAGLLTQRARRRRAEETIRTSEATLRLSYERIRQLAGRLINAQDVVRAGIARDLHDDVCQKLVYISMGLNGLKNSSSCAQDPHAQQTLSDLERDMLLAFDGIRRLSHDLHPAALRLLGLGPALKAHCAEVAKRHNVDVIFEPRGDLGQIHPDVAVCFFRIAQEALRNGLMHGAARRFAVSVARSGDYLELTVTDDGRGFDVEAMHRDGTGLGLVSMEERARLVGSDAHIVSRPEEGTTVRVRGPADLPQRPDGEDSESVRKTNDLQPAARTAQETPSSRIRRLRENIRSVRELRRKRGA
jgi:signal transduction histidine kinase